MISLVLRVRGVGCAYRRMCWLLARLCYPHVRIPEDAKLSGVPLVICAQGSTIRVGRRFAAVSNSAFNVVGVSHPCVMRTLREGARITIGDDVGMSGTSLACALSINIGDRCMIGADVMIMDSDLHSLDQAVRRYAEGFGQPEPVSIGDDVFVGARSIILKGVSVGSGATIGAGSVVTSDVAPGQVVAGCPARPVESSERLK